MVVTDKTKPTRLQRGKQDVIDLGAPKKPRTPRVPYTPSARLYPGSQAPKKKKYHEGGTTLHRRSKARQPRPLVPNPRLYQPCPRRVNVSPPPLCPSVPWKPPVTVSTLDTASKAALRLSECRACGSNSPMTLHQSHLTANGQAKLPKKQHRRSRRQLRSFNPQTMPGTRSFTTPDPSAAGKGYQNRPLW